MIIDTKIKLLWKDYKYCFLGGGSKWLKLYKNKEQFITIYSTETKELEVITMDLFNDIVDYYINTEFGFINENELHRYINNSK